MRWVGASGRPLGYLEAVPRRRYLMCRRFQMLLDSLSIQQVKREDLLACHRPLGMHPREGCLIHDASREAANLEQDSAKPAGRFLATPHRVASGHAADRREYAVEPAHDLTHCDFFRVPSKLITSYFHGTSS